MSFLKIKDSLYSNDIYFIFDETDEKVFKFIKKKTNTDLKKEDIENSIAYVHEANLNTYFIVMRDLEKSFIETLVHECFHVTAQVMRVSQVDLTRQSEEAYAYYLEWIFTQCLKRSKRLSAKNKQMGTIIS